MYRVIIPILLSLVGFKSGAAYSATQEPIKVVLVAEITVENATSEPVNGYVHRVAIPVEGHMQQQLLAVRQSGKEPIKRKTFHQNVGEFLELEWDIPAKTTSTREIYFDLLITPYDIAGKNDVGNPDHAKVSTRESDSAHELSAFQSPSEYIESDAKEIKRLAEQIQQNYSDPEAQLRAAYMIPQQMLHYRRQSTKGALYAVTRREGDCTEFAALFVAIARAMGYPARMTSEFLFTKHRDFSQPNHHAAEVYFKGRWVPVDANLALDPEFGYGFGLGGSKKVVLNRNSVWVWSNLWPKGVRDRKGHVDVDMHWRIEKPGAPQALSRTSSDSGQSR